MLAAIAIPNFVMVRQKAMTRVCMANMTQIKEAYSAAGNAGVKVTKVSELVPHYPKYERHSPLDSSSYVIDPSSSAAPEPGAMITIATMLLVCSRSGKTP